MEHKTVRDHIIHGLKSAQLMQLATVAGDKPWVCTVYFVVDDSLNLYWLSYPSRRHSQEIKGTQNVAVAIAVKHDKPVIGIQAEGQAQIVQDHEVIARVMESYIKKYDSGRTFYDNFLAGKNDHTLYKFTPQRFSLFDEINYPESSPQEYLL